jgi:hypothetical protein
MIILYEKITIPLKIKERMWYIADGIFIALHLWTVISDGTIYRKSDFPF